MRTYMKPEVLVTHFDTVDSITDVMMLSNILQGQEIEVNGQQKTITTVKGVDFNDLMK